MVRAIVGYSGFVGSNLLQFYKFDYFYNSKNFIDAKEMFFDEIYFCGVPAVKWRANKYPQEDIDIIDSIKDILKTIKTNRIVLISTIDVYEDVDYKYDEDYDCDWVINHHYGRNRYMFEYFIKKNFTNYNIIRLPALFGKGLKKNIIYDLINNNQIENIPINSEFQWYDLDWLKNDIEIILNNDIKISNLFTEPLDTRSIIELFNYDVAKYNNNQKKIIYNTHTKYSKIFNSNINGYVRDNKVVLENLKKYINLTKLNITNLCVSNICIKNLSQLQFACILKLYDIKNIQIAPTTLIDNWSNLNKLDLSIYTDQNIKPYSFQSIAYGLNDLNIFTDTSNDLLIHIKNIIDIAFKNNIHVLVFGCPRNRYIIDEILHPFETPYSTGVSYEQALQNSDQLINDNKFIDFFKILGEYCFDKNIIICIENNSKEYNCNYLNNITEVGNIVNKINHPNIKMMVDLGNATMENDNFENMYNYKDIIYNIDIAEPFMKSFTIPGESNINFIKILNNINYNKKINLEMILDKNNELESLIYSLNNFIQLYSNISL
jgi:sugar phosphate isomerase/epimerase